VIVFLDGRFVPEERASISVFDRGFLLGDGLFETLRVANGRPFRFAQHLERLSRGADFLKIRLPFTLDQIHRFAAQLIEQNQLTEAILRLTLTRGPGKRGYSTIGADQPTLAMALHPVPEIVDEPLQWNLVTSSLRIPAGDGLGAFKTTSKILNVLARAEAEERGADEALLLNTQGEVAETAGGNVFWVHQGKICTAPTSLGILPGITRAVVLEVCHSLGLEADKRIITREQLRAVDGIFVTQSAQGIIPVASLDDVPVPSSPLVERIVLSYEKTLREECR
jgi:branched-subunit amino acid aminotransferase/4-amino-4-deoxychorismate lyase